MKPKQITNFYSNCESKTLSFSSNVEDIKDPYESYDAPLSPLQDIGLLEFWTETFECWIFTVARRDKSRPKHYRFLLSYAKKHLMQT